jgi:hypothetical protein
MKTARALVVFAICISLSGVVIHVSALFAGLSWLTFFNAPRSVVDSYKAGTWLAPVSCLVIASLMSACAYYAASALGLVRRPVLQRTGLAGMAIICIVRALLLPALATSHPELRNTFEVVAALIWGLAGVGFAVALTLAKTMHIGSAKHISFTAAAPQHN